jgi:hypothetical protein
MPFEGAWVPGNVLTRLSVDEVLWGRMKIEVRVFWVLLLTAGEIFGQSDLASITGTVRDSSGAVVAGAQVTVTNARDELQASAATNATGAYTVLNLPVGRYNFVCSMEGFKKYERSDINLAISQVAEIDAVLTVAPSVGQFGARFVF